MPEGDTIHRAAARMRAALRGSTIRQVEFRDRAAPSIVGTTVVEVRAAGKHLLITFSDGTVLRTHMRMTGSWHLYRRGERWQRPRHQARLVLSTDTWEAVGFNVPEIEVSRVGAAEKSAATRHLGPDLTSAEPDIEQAVARFAALDPETEIGVAMLDQRVACGVGNVYKSEVLWALRVDPFTPVGRIDEATRRSLLVRASSLLRANLATTTRTTVPGGVAVYGKAGLPCRRCGDRIERRRQGEHARSTYWCPTCQAPGAQASDHSSRL